MADPVLIDMTGGAPDQASGATVTLDDVVVLPADGAEGEQLPPRAALQPDGSVILTLREPVVMRWTRDGEAVREERHEALHMHRLNGAAMRAVMSAGQGHAVTTGIAKSCRMAQAVFDKLFDRMDGADAAAAAQVFSFFLSGGDPKATGRPSSP